MADERSGLSAKESEALKAGAQPSGVKDEPAVTAATKKAAEIAKERVNPSAPGNTGTTAGSNADVG